MQMTNQKAPTGQELMPSKATTLEEAFARHNRKHPESPLALLTEAETRAAVRQVRTGELVMSLPQYPEVDLLEVLREHQQSEAIKS